MNKRGFKRFIMKVEGNPAWCTVNEIEEDLEEYDEDLEELEEAIEWIEGLMDEMLEEEYEESRCY